MKANPFKFGEHVTGEYFAARYKERELLMGELFQSNNIFLTGAHQIGKTSLAHKVLHDLERKGIITVYIDLAKAYSPIRFIEIYLTELLRSAFRQIKDLKIFIQTLNPSLKQKLLLRVEESGELTLDLSKEEDIFNIATAILELSQYAVEYRKRKCVVCLDDVLRGGNLPLKYRKLLLSLANKHNQVGYLFLAHSVQNKARLRNFTYINLDRIEERYLKAYIKTRFENTGFRIPDSIINQIIKIATGYPHYVQMICYELWNQIHTGQNISNKNIFVAIEETIRKNHEYYMFLWNSLSLHQKNLLLAICKGGGEKIFSQNYVSNYSLGSFSTVQKSLNGLISKKILEIEDKCYNIRNMFFKQWLKRRML